MFGGGGGFYNAKIDNNFRGFDDFEYEGYLEGEEEEYPEEGYEEEECALKEDAHFMDKYSR